MRVTLAIHTYRYAIRLKSALEQAGIQVWLQDVNTGSEAVDENMVSAGIRVRIQESDLPGALHLVESEELANVDATEGRVILVPIDFSKRGLQSCLIAARMALRGSMDMVLLHACPTPYFEGQLPTVSGDNLLYADENTEAELEEVKEAKTIQQSAKVEMKRYLKMMQKYCADAGLTTLPKISTVISEGVPEEVIAQYYKDHSVGLVVMSTRDTETRSSQLIGSVTAEVVDNAQISVLTIPDVQLKGESIFKYTLMFCNLDQEDLLLVDYLMRMSAGVENTKVVLVPVNERARNVEERTARLAQALSERYPQCEFTYLLSVSGLSHDDLKAIIKSMQVTMVALSNRRRNILARIFKPGLAHKVLFTNDVPLFALSSNESV